MGQTMKRYSKKEVLRQSSDMEFYNAAKVDGELERVKDYIDGLMLAAFNAHPKDSFETWVAENPAPESVI